MKHIFTKCFTKNYRQFPVGIQKKFDKQLNYLLQNIRHPSLQAKKYDKEKAIWQAKVDRNYRFYFLIEKDTYILLDITIHP